MESEEFETIEAVLEAVRHGSTEFGGHVGLLSVNSRGFFGNVPLIPVITWGSESGVKLLLASGADIDAVCEQGNTPLHHAIQMGEFKVARVLIGHGANQEIKNAAGKLPRDLCCDIEWPGLFGEPRA